MIRLIKDKCSGCSACYNICPKKCIEMVYDDDGFLYPKINEEICVNCRLCESVCPILDNDVKNNFNESYAAFSVNKNVLKNSSSGGVFHELASYIIEKNGIICGASFSDDYKKVEHIFVDNLNELEKIQTSKYVQSTIGNTYNMVLSYLNENRIVLFSGTPCQITGLKKFLNKEYENLICVEIICHGVPSPKVWNKYLDYIEGEYQGKIEYYNFRNKNNGWKHYGSLWIINNKMHFSNYNNNIYMQLFLNNLSLRPSCFNCKVNEMGSSADIVLGDFWGIDSLLPEIQYYDGVSAVVINTKKGNNVFNNIKNNTIFYKVQYKDIINSNELVLSSAKKPSNYEQFMNDFAVNDFSYIVKKYHTKRNIKYFIKKILNKLRIY